MNILVTGGAGYVGSHCVRALCAAGHGVVVLDNLSTGHRRAVDAKATLVEGDIGDAALLKKVFADGSFHAVMHFAALAEVGESVRNPLKYYRNNVINSIGLLEACRTHDVKTFVFSSSCAVYGIPSSVPITENAARVPISPYGRTKLAIEWVLEDCVAAWGLGATALRYFNAAGASADSSIGEDHDPETHLIPLVLRVASGRMKEIKVFGVDYPTSDGSCVRDYVHVEDLAAVHRLAVEGHPAATFRAFNVGTGNGASVKQVIEASRKITGHDIPAAPGPRRDGDPPELYADPTKIQTELGWKPQYTDIERTIETAWKWFDTHPDGYGDRS